MAKVSSQEEDNKPFECAKRQLDKVWQEKHGYPCFDWIINTAKNDTELRAMGYFLQPNLVDVVGKELYFKETPEGAMAERMWRNCYFDILTKHKFSIYKKPVPEMVKWEAMNDTEKIGFAKGIWAKRPILGSEPAPFAPYIQEMLCRMKNAPSPEVLKEILLNHNINLSSLISHGRHET